MAKKKVHIKDRSEHKFVNEQGVKVKTIFRANCKAMVKHIEINLNKNAKG